MQPEVCTFCPKLKVSSLFLNAIDAAIHILLLSCIFSMMLSCVRYMGRSRNPHLIRTLFIFYIRLRKKKRILPFPSQNKKTPYNIKFIAMFACLRCLL